jgi:hypothetical protein
MMSSYLLIEALDDFRGLLELIGWIIFANGLAESQCRCEQKKEKEPREIHSISLLSDSDCKP